MKRAALAAAAAVLAMSLVAAQQKTPEQKKNQAQQQKAPAPESAYAPGGRTAPPPPSDPRPMRLPKPVEKTLPNGLRVIVAERRQVPLVAAQLIVKSGGEVDPPELWGLADITANLLTKGTATRTAPQIAEEVETLGATLGSDGGWDASEATLTSLSTKLAPAAQVLADVVRRPAFKEEELERLRQQRLDDLRVELGRPGSVARMAADRIVFGSAPYGHPAAGTPESVARITRDDVVKMHRTYYRPDNAVLVIGGDVDAAAAFALAERLFGDWARPATPLEAPASEREHSRLGAPAAAPVPANAASRVVFIDKPDAGQAAVVLATRGIRRADPDYFKAIVANSVLSGFSGRLNQEIRIKRGLSYGAHASLEARRDVGPFSESAQTKNESAPEVARLLREELARLAAGELNEAELAPRRAVLIGSFARRFETAEGLVGTLSALALYGIGFDQIERYVPSVQAVRPEDVKGLAGTRLPSKGASIVIVGDGRKLIAGLAKEFPIIERIPIAELDLSSPTLRKAQPKK